MKVSLVLSTHAAQFEAVALRGDLDANLARIAGWGYDGVELAIRDPRLVDAGELLRAVRAHGLEVPAIGTGQAWGEEGLSFTDPDRAVRAAAVERALSHIPFAASAGAVVIIGLLRGMVRQGTDQAQAMAWLVDALRACCDAARPHGVRFALEPICRYETTLVNNATQGLDLLEQVGADNMGLLLDTFHMNIEDASIEESIRRCGDRIFHFHVADSNRWHPGAGHLDFARILDVLFSTGYQGHVSGEFMPLPDAETAARRGIAHLCACVRAATRNSVSRRNRVSGDRFFDPDPAQRRIARELHEAVAGLPLICPHGHVDPGLFSDENATLGTPAEMLILPDHYVFRMLYSQGIPLEALGLRPLDGGPFEADHRKVWQLFAGNYYLFRGTPTALWLDYVFRQVFGVEEKLTAQTAQRIYDHLADCVDRPEFRPRALFERFNIEVLCTTDFASDPLSHHQAIRASGWSGDVRPTFRADDVLHLLRPGWRQNLQALGEAAGVEIDSYPRLIRALEARRAFFRAMGATATDHDGTSLATGELSPGEADAILQRALKGLASPADAERFFGHMLMESARMSIDDGLVMQVHFGSFRNHNAPLYERFGPDRGCDIPFQAEFTRNLRPLLNRYGNDPRLTLVVFTLDESTYTRELAPLAGHYPALKVGPAWWFHDSVNGMVRYRQRVIETAGLHNTAGFNDDTRSFPSIPARHDLARRVDANWLAGLVVRAIVDMEDAHEMMLDLSYRLAKATYKLGGGGWTKDEG